MSHATTTRAVEQPPAEPPVPGRRSSANLEIAAVGLGALAASLAQTLIIPVLPSLTADLHTTTGNAQWLLTSTLLVAAVSVPVMSRFADMFGRKLLLLVSLTGLAAGSVLDALTSNFTLMLIGRALTGLSAASIPLGISLLAAVLPPARRSSATALVSAMLGIGSALGLPLAGIIGDNADYHILYWIGGAAAVLSLALVVVAVAEPAFERQHHIDWGGIVLLGTGLTALILAISEGNTWGWAAPATLGCFAGAVVAIALLGVAERRAENPLIDLGALLQKPVALTDIASLFVGFALFASFTGTASYVQAPKSTGYGFGSSILVGGLCLLPSGLLMVLLAPLAARLMNRIGPALVLAGGGLVIALGLAERIVFTGHLYDVVIGATVIGAGTGVAYASLPALINTHSRPEALAAANGLNSLARSLGSSLASAVGGALLSAITMSVAGAALPSLTGYRVLFAICGVAALVAAAIGLTVSRSSRPVASSAG